MSDSDTKSMVLETKVGYGIHESLSRAVRVPLVPGSEDSFCSSMSSPAGKGSRLLPWLVADVLLVGNEIGGPLSALRVPRSEDGNGKDIVATVKSCTEDCRSITAIITVG